MKAQKLGPLVVQRLRHAKLDDDLVAEFVGVTTATIDTWLRKNIVPRGQQINRLWHLLALAGVDSPELKRVSAYGRYLGELMAYDLVSLEAAQHSCKLLNEQGVLHIIRGEQSPPTRPRDTLEDLRVVYGDDLEKAKRVWKEKLGLDDQEADPVQADVEELPAVLPTPVPALLHMSADPGKHDRLLAIAQRFAAVTADARYLVSAGCTAEDRELVRELLGEDGMFNFSNLVNKLCSERALNQ
ncbi:MAG TPA: hypothetical protein VK694_03605 [Verrucomicrobiae bacterium]|nr:hypothetical protein [Verrucomicrobiae bacterium]